MLLLVTKAVPSLVRLQHPNLGRLVTPRHWSNLPGCEAAGIPWAADNDAFSGFNEEPYIKMLEGCAQANECMFVSCPDIVGDGAGTLALYKHWQPRVAGYGLPVALVGQDGMEALPIPWSRVDALFVGGSTHWKLGPAAARLIRTAKSMGKWVHMGRVNSAKRIRIAHALGCDSVDGSGYSRFFDTHVPKALELLEELG